MGATYSYSSCGTSSSSFSNCTNLSSHSSQTNSKVTALSHKLPSNLVLFNPNTRFFKTHIQKLSNFTTAQSHLTFSINCGRIEEMEMQKEEDLVKPVFDPRSIEPELLQQMSYDALVWCSLHGLLVGDRNSERSGKVPGVGMVHAPFSLLPMTFPSSHFKQACEIAPIFNELIDRVSLDGKFLQDSLSRTKKVDAFTSRLLDIHSKMLEINKKEIPLDTFVEDVPLVTLGLNDQCYEREGKVSFKEIRLGLHRSDYMLDEQTKLLLQIELNTISSSFPGLSCLVGELHRMLLNQFKEQLSLNPEMIPRNDAVNGFAEALAKAWLEYDKTGSVIMVVVQPEERNMYDQHWLSTVMKERHQVRTIRKTLAEINAAGELQPDGTLLVGGEAVAVIYFRAGYAPTDYLSELEWRARLLMEQSSAIKCPSISYHLAGTKKIQQELAKPGILERFLDNNEDIAKVRRCFAGLWSLDDSEIIKDAIERPGLYVMKPQREGGGNNIYGDAVKKNLLRLQQEGNEENAAYILMQRIFPTISPSILMRDGVSYRDQTISELGVYGAYLRNKTKVIKNDHCGYLMRTKVSSSDEGGVAAGFAVLDSLYLV